MVWGSEHKDGLSRWFRITWVYRKGYRLSNAIAWLKTYNGEIKYIMINTACLHCLCKRCWILHFSDLTAALSFLLQHQHHLVAEVHPPQQETGSMMSTFIYLLLVYRNRSDVLWQQLLDLIQYYISGKTVNNFLYQIIVILRSSFYDEAQHIYKGL